MCFRQHANKLNSEQVKLQASYNGRRKQIDIQAAEMEDLRCALSTQGTLLDKAVTERNRAETRSRDVQTIIRGLEADLKRVQKDADRFGEDLKRLRQQKDDMETRHNEERAQHERKSKQSRSQIRLLRDQLETQNQLQVTNADPYVFSGYCCVEGNLICHSFCSSMSNLKLIHKKECKGLFVQIRYLKAKFVREAALRADLGYQKQYLLIVLSQFETRSASAFRCLAVSDLLNPTARNAYGQHWHKLVLQLKRNARSDR